MQLEAMDPKFQVLDDWPHNQPVFVSLHCTDSSMIPKTARLRFLRFSSQSNVAFTGTRLCQVHTSNLAMDNLYIPDTPTDVKNAKAIHLLTANTGNGQAVQILLEELAEAYGFSWTTTLVDIWSIEQKKECTLFPTNLAKSEWVCNEGLRLTNDSIGFLRLNPNGRIPVVIDNRHNPPVTVHESSAGLIYLLKTADKEKRFGFEDEVESNDLVQWLFFWHGSGAPYQGQLIHFTKAAPERNECEWDLSFRSQPIGFWFFHLV
jgi:hypothetical protein